MTTIYLVVYLSGCYLSGCLSIWLSNYLLNYISGCLSICLHFYLLNYISGCLSICLTIYLVVYPSARLSICLSIYLLKPIYLVVYLSVCLSTCLKLYIWLFIYLVVYLPLLSWCIAVYSVQCKPINYSCLSFRINWPRIPGENSKGFWKRVLAASSLNKLPCPYSDFVEQFRFSGFLFYYSIIVNSSNKNTYFLKNIFSPIYKI